MRSRLLTAVGLLAAAAAVGAALSIAVVGGPSATATPRPLPTTTATVARTDLDETQLTEGTLGYAPTDPLVNRLRGTYTELPDPATTVRPGGVLYRVDNSPVVLMTGTTPAWRPFAPAMADGPDVAQLQSNLVALGDAHGLFSSATGHFDDATVQAVERWQSSVGMAATGEIPLGQIAFLAGTVRIGAPSVAVGQTASDGQSPLEVTTADRVVSVPLTPDLPTVTVGDNVGIVLPDESRTTGTVSSVVAPPPGSGSGSGGSSSPAGGNGGSSQPQVVALATVTPDHPAATGQGSGIAVQVSLTVQSARDVLAVPISALLALAGGGYGVEVVGPTGAHHLVGVTTGVFTGTQVQVAGEGIEAGTKVVVAQ